ncbi:DEAD/DEAH box helicase family protein [Labrenzia sp. ac12]
MQSANFEILRGTWPELATLGGFAEAYAYADPASALVKLRLFAENLTKDIYRDLKLPRPDGATQFELLRNGAFEAITPSVVLDKLHAIRIHGNKAAHGKPAETRDVLWLLKEAFDLACWACVRFDGERPEDLPAYQEPQASAGSDTKAQLKREKKAALQKLAAQEAQMDALLKELEAARLVAETAEKTAKELAALKQSAVQSANLLQFDEATTRARIIDSLIAEAGWNVAARGVQTEEVGQEVEVKHQPTASGIGYADYVLWDDNGLPLAVIEAKKTSVDPNVGRKQAQLYADALEKDFGQRPVIYTTNGYDIWMWDDVLGYPPRKVFGYYSKGSLQYLVNVQRKGRQALDTLVPKDTIVNRLYQIEAIKRVSERFAGKHRKALIVQATGTGKTRVAIALTDLLIRAGWVKRVLFLCDRKELRRQAKNAFNDFVSEPIKVVNSRVNEKAPERIFLATYPGMKKIYRSFDVGFFDLIIADESHRSIYNIYGDIFTYFDALQVGLTATPVDFVARNTFSLFGCDNQLPTSNYSLEDAIAEKWLTPFEVFEHTTSFLRDGIKLAGLTPEQVRELEEQGEDPSEYDFSADQIDQIIYNKDTNRLILRNLMENGLKDASGQRPGKSIIFARNHHHAVLLKQMFDEMYPQYGGKLCQVIDNYDPRAEQLIDDFKDPANDLTIAVSVDMLDTGIDVPEVVNLAFAKPIKSPVKFMQMIGRGTRLCEDLFGPRQNKTVFRIFDHWGNFERFGTGYKPAESGLAKPLFQKLFEERLTLAETALRESEIPAFEEVITLIAGDINALSEETVAVREKWREKRSLSEPAVLKAFAPGTVARLRQEIAPLMMWRDLPGPSAAFDLDLLMARAQMALLRRSGDLVNYKTELLDRVGTLEMHLNPVKEKAAEIKEVKSEAFWRNVTFNELERMRLSLRDIMHHRTRGAGGSLPPKVIDVTEKASGIQTAQRSSNIATVDMKAYEQLVEAELKKHFDTNATLRKIRAGEAVSQADLDALVSLVLVQSDQARRDDLKDFFDGIAEPLDQVIRSIVGLDPDVVRDRFADFARKHPGLSAKQTRFLNLLQNHIARHGAITLDKLYERPFTVVDADGLDGVFENTETADDLISVVNTFVPRGTSTGDEPETTDDPAKGR